MFLNGFRNRAEDHAGFGELGLEGRGDRNGIEDRIDGDAIASQLLAEIVFDFYVNAGFHAITLLQRLLGPPLASDGLFGPDTLKALEDADQAALYARYRQGRIDYYTELAQAHPILQRFLAGWLRRATWFPAQA